MRCGARIAVFCVGWWLVGAVAAAGDELRLVLPAAPAEPVIAEGFSEDDLESLRRRGEGYWRSVFGVFVDGSGELPPMLGTYRLDSGRLSFTPRFPFQPEQRYRVELLAGGHRSTETFVIDPSERVPTTRVTSVDPAPAEVPENLLRFYIHFSAPMRGGEVYRSVWLLDERGETIEQAFVETEPELWDRERRRLTLISHPGRIKRGLEMRARQGPAIRAGETFRLVVDIGMLDADGAPLVESFMREFSVTTVDRRSPVIADWVLRAPSALAAPLSIEFDEPLDPALLRRLIAVETAAGDPVPGRGESGPDGRSWRFQPATAWSAGSYAVLVHPSLEDLAGNRLDRPFDVAGDGAAAAQRTDPIRLPFVIEP